MDVMKGKRANVASSGLAFSLIELLVVIAVIAILAALLLPALAKAKERARALKSLSNVKQWVYAFHMYGDDNEDYFPYEGDPFTAINMGLNLDAWYNVTPIYMVLPPLKDLYILGARPRPGDNSVFVCPNVRKEPTPPPSLSNPYFMYGFNNRMDPNGSPRFKRTEVIYPADTITFTENDGRFPSATYQTPARHSMRANLGFVDGHASAVHTNDYRRDATEDNSISEFSIGRKVYWFPYPGATN
jgi:prepilin-type N-terminal cleavage/methylation domain-containing protein/prepilin-type processing-associated H-X9-DG protein